MMTGYQAERILDNIMSLESVQELSQFDREDLYEVIADYLDAFTIKPRQEERVAHSKSEYRRLKAQGVDVQPPNTEERCEYEERWGFRHDASKCPECAKDTTYPDEPFGNPFEVSASMQRGKNKDTPCPDAAEDDFVNILQITDVDGYTWIRTCDIDNRQIAIRMIEEYIEQHPLNEAELTTLVDLEDWLKEEE